MRPRSFKRVLKRSANMYKNSASQFLKTTTRVNSGPDALEESKLAINFVSILGVIG